MSDLANVAQAALIILKNIRPSLIGHMGDPKKVELALEPVFGFYWAKNLSIDVEAGVIDDFLHFVKGDSLPQEKIDRGRQWFKGTFYAEAGPYPLHWELWGKLITDFNLYEIDPLPLWMAAVSSLEESYLFTPLTSQYYLT